MQTQTASAPASSRREPRQQRSHASVQRILDATSRVLARVPLSEVTTTQVAQEAGISIGGLYRFFPDRQALIDAVAVRRMDEFAALLEQELAAMLTADTADLLGSVVDRYVRFLDANPDFRQIAIGREVSTRTRKQHVGPNTGVTAVVRQFFVDRFGLELTGELDLKLTIANEVGERLIAFAYEQSSAEERARVIAEMKRLLSGYFEL